MPISTAALGSLVAPGQVRSSCVASEAPHGAETIMSYVTISLTPVATEACVFGCLVLGRDALGLLPRDCRGASGWKKKKIKKKIENHPNIFNARERESERGMD